ncbi:fumarate hydratase [candidate division KSB1 bacterium]
MAEIKAAKITAAVRDMCIDAASVLSDDVLETLKNGLAIEESPVGKRVLTDILENARIAKEEGLPMCQDTGLAVVFCRVGQEIRITGGDLREALNEGVRQGYSDGYLRKSIVEDPLRRVNTGDNTPALVYFDIVPGDKLEISLAAKGAGSENMSEVKMLKPADGMDGVVAFVVDRVARSGANPCPPIVVGVGIGGSFEMSAMLAKQSHLRALDDFHPDPFYRELEFDLLDRINKLGIGPQGLGGRITALGVHVETYPCHIASLPVAVNINCHAYRHRSVTM